MDKMEDIVDYGPLEALIGTWEGDKGMDIAPESDGTEEHNPYYEVIEIIEGGDLENANVQTLSMVSYHQLVTRKSDGKVFHDEVGYWIWDADRKTVIRSFTIPRAVAIVAGGSYTDSTDGKVVLEVSAAVNNHDWDIAQSPFMKEKAKTTAFESRFEVDGDTLNYFQNTSLEIYGRSFDHTDENVLTRVSK